MKASTSNKNSFDTLVLKVGDMCKRSAEKYCPCFTGFLSLEEQAALLKEAEKYRDVFVLLFGGIACAERKIAGIFSVDCYNEPDSDESLLAFEEMAEISYVKIQGSGFVNIGHRDVLGSVMSLGLKREVLGDIIVTENSKCSYIAVKKSAAGYICANLDRVARDKVKVSEIGKSDVPERKQKFSDMVLTISSLRLDALVGAAVNISRDKAKKLINAGKVAINHSECTSCDTQISSGDTVTVKGEGKFYIEDSLGLTAKEKHRIVVRKYI